MLSQLPQGLAIGEPAVAFDDNDGTASLWCGTENGNVRIQAEQWIIDDLVSNESGAALSARQGKILKDLIDAIGSGGSSVNVVDNLVSTSPVSALSARQGNVLNTKITNHANNQTDEKHIEFASVEPVDLTNTGVVFLRQDGTQDAPGRPSLDELKQEIEEIDVRLTEQLAQTENDLFDLAVNVMDYGAVGNGIADDYQAFVDALNVPRITRLLIPNRVFMIASDNTIQIPDKIEIICDGQIITNPTRTKPLFEINQKQGVQLTRLKVNGQKSAQELYVENAHALIIRSSDVIVNKCEFINMGGDGVYIGRDYTLSEIVLSSVIVQDCKIHNCKRNSVAITSGNRVHILRNTITTDDNGVFNRSATVDIEPNNPDDHLIGIHVIGNYIKALTNSASIRGLCAGGKESNIYQDIFYDDNTIVCMGNPEYAIVHDGGLKRCKNSSVSKNRIFGPVKTAIYALGCGNNVKTDDNYIEQSSVSGIRASYGSGEVYASKNTINVTSGRAIYLMNNTGDTFIIKDNTFSGSSNFAESMMVAGNNTCTNVVVAGNTDRITGTTSGLRVYQCSQVRVRNNISEKLTLTSNVDVIDSDNTVNGVFPKQFGTTAERPSRRTIGQHYFDTTLKKDIIWSGTAWLDAMGTSV